MTTTRVYLDHAATTSASPEAIEAMLRWLRPDVVANPSSVHGSGQKARAAVEQAREQVAQAIGGVAAEVTFTSGATEADGLAVHGFLATCALERPLLVSRTEHAAVLRAADAEERRGRPVVRMAVDRTGVVTPQALEDALDQVSRRGAAPAALVSIMHTNNETGVVADVPALARVAHAHGAAFHCDAVQALGYAAIDVHAWGADLVVLSSHKIGGPQGVGALWVRDGLPIEPRQLGGQQERGRRAGTHAVAAIVGFGVAARDAAREHPARAARAAEVRDRLEARLLLVEGVHVNVGGDVARGPKHLNVHVGGVDGEALLYALDAAGLEVSAGSACAAGSLEPSHVLVAMGRTIDEARGSVRFSTSHRSTLDEADRAASTFDTVVAHLRALDL